MEKIKFVSYNGAFPNYCRGELVLEINGQIRRDIELISGGHAYWDGEDYIIEEGPWSTLTPEDLILLTKEIEDCVNENIPWGCCGGCI